MCVSAGRISPIAPRISAVPISRMAVGLTFSPQPWPDLTSFSFGHDELHRSAGREGECEDTRDDPQGLIHDEFLCVVKVSAFGGRHNPRTVRSAPAQLSSWSNRVTAASLCSSAGVKAAKFSKSVNNEKDSC